MKRIIITPTFRPHFPFNRDFLRSFEQNVLDALEIAVHFIVSNTELADMQSLLNEFPTLDVHAHAFEDLLRASGYEVESSELLQDVGKFAFQSLKKLYALKVLEFDQALILDSESLVLKQTRVEDAFNEYFADPFVFYSDLSHRGDYWYGTLGDIVNQNVGKLLRIPAPKMHLLEYYGWFYEKRLVRDLFAALPKDLLVAVRERLGKNKHFFECFLFYAFLYENRDHYGYRFVSVNELLREYLGPAGYEEYIGNFKEHWEQVGIFEYVSKEITEHNLPALLKLFEDKKLRFYRSEIVNRNERAQDALIAQSPITFLVSSENYRRIRERVAICLSGLSRNYRQNLRFAQNFLADSGADVFFHFWESPDQDFIVRSLEPKGYEFENAKEFATSSHALDLSGPRRREKFVPPQRDDASVAMFYSIWRANELKRDYERKHGFRYDIVVRLQMNFFALDNLTDIIDRIRAQQRGFDHTLYLPDMAHSSGINDHMAIGSSETMDAFAMAYSEIEAFTAKDYFNPEYFLLRYVLKNGLTILTFPFQYLPLRDEALDVFGLQEQIEYTMTNWSSAPLPKIPASALMNYFRAKADSVYWMAELGMETPKVFRLKSPTQGYLRLDPASRTLSFANDPADASVFFLIVAGDENRIAVNIRCRDLNLENEQSQTNGVRGWNLYPDQQGVIRPDGAADSRSAFFLGRRDEGFTFEWMPGFWQSPAARGEFAAAEEPQEQQRLFLAVRPTGLTLQLAESGVEAFGVEYVKDPEAEATAIGIQAPQVSVNAPISSDTLLVKLSWRFYVAARILEANGMSDVLSKALELVRKRSHRAASEAEPKGVWSLVNRTVGLIRRKA